MTSLGSNDDCYFYYYSSCTKGDSCPFRHCEAALGTETVCSLWREGACFRDNCKFRHMESRINRGTIRCYWEDQPSGCLKPHCVFYHCKPRHNIGNSSARNEGLILPVSTSGLPPIPSPKLTEAKDAAKNITFNPVESYSNSSHGDELMPPSLPVEPIVVSFDGEESDSESASSTPMKSVYDSKYNSDSAKSDLIDRFSENNNLGIKTLEQIKMEKIHKESDNIYKSAYEAPFIDPVALKLKTDSYPPQSEFIKISDRPAEKSVSANTEQYSSDNETGIKSRLFSRVRNSFPESEFIKISDRPAEKSVSANTEQYSSDNETGIKSRLSKRVLHPTYLETSSPPKKMVCLKKSKDEPLDFKVKTLDEIREEKRSKSSKKEELSIEPNGTKAISNGTKISTSVRNLKAESTNLNGKCFRRIKINRQSNESIFDTNASEEAYNSTESQKVIVSNNGEKSVFRNNKIESTYLNERSYRKIKLNRQSKETVLNSNVSQADGSTENQKSDDRTQMVLHEVQNIAEDQKKTDIRGKRKETDDSIHSECTSPKLFKSELSSTSSTRISPSHIDSKNSVEEKPVNKSNRLIIKRKRSSAISMPPTPASESEVSSTVVQNGELRNSSPTENNKSPKTEAPLPSVANTETKTPKTSVDELDSFLMNEEDVNLDYEPDGGINESDDILLEIAQLLDS